MDKTKVTLVVSGIVEILLGLWGLMVSSSMALISAFIDDPNDVLTDGWAVVVLLLSLASIAGGIFTIRRKRWIVSLIGAVGSVAPSLPFAMMLLPNMNFDNGFELDTLLAFLWILSLALVIITFRMKQSFGK